MSKTRDTLIGDFWIAMREKNYGYTKAIAVLLDTMTLKRIEKATKKIEEDK